MGEMHVVTSALSIARELHRYGEPALASEALTLTPVEVAELGRRMGVLHLTGEAERLWPQGPAGNQAYLLAAIERLEGKARPCRRTRRLPEESLPEHLRATEEELWAAAEPVASVVRGWQTTQR